jgi:hypothetical protein
MLEAMLRVTISGAAQAVADDPRSRQPITDPEILQQLHGAQTEETCDEHLPAEVRGKGIYGGRLVLAYNQSSGLRVETTYRVYGELGPERLARLIAETESQWSDGIGSGAFRSRQGEFLSTDLAMGLGEPSEPGSVFVNVYPDVADRAIRHEAQPATNPDILAAIVITVLVAIGLLVIWMM